MDLWNSFIVRPLGWVLLQIYSAVGNYGVAIILFAILAKAALLYFTFRGKYGMMQTQRLQPRMKELEKQCAGDKQKYQQEVQKLYTTEGVSPMSGCLWTFIQFPILIALFGIVREPLTNLMLMTKEQITQVAQIFNIDTVKDSFHQLTLANLIHQNYSPELAALGAKNIDFNFLGVSLTSIPKDNLLSLAIILPILSVASSVMVTFVSQKMSGVKLEGQMKMMNYTMPLITVWFTFTMPNAMGLYWTISNVLTMIQEYFMTKYYRKVFDQKDEERRQFEERRRAAEEAQRLEAAKERAERLASQRKGSGKKNVKYYKKNGGLKKSDDGENK